MSPYHNFQFLSLNFPVYFKIEIEKIFKLAMKCLLSTGFYRLLFITKSSTMGGTDEDRDAIYKGICYFSPLHLLAYDNRVRQTEASFVERFPQTSCISDLKEHSWRCP